MNINNMTNNLANDLAHHLEMLTPDEFVRKAFFDYLYKECEIIDGVFQIPVHDEIYQVPIDCELNVVSRILQHDAMPVWTQIKVVIALGGIVNPKPETGVVIARIVSTKLYFNELLEVYSLDIPY